MGKIPVFRGHRDDLIDSGIMRHFPKKMDIDRHETGVHDCRRIGMNDQRVDGKYNAAHRVDDPQFENGRHKE